MGLRPPDLDLAEYSLDLVLPDLGLAEYLLT